MHHALRHAWGTRCGNTRCRSRATLAGSHHRAARNLFTRRVICTSRCRWTEGTNENGGRVNVGNELIHWDAQAPSARLSPLVHAPIEHVVTCGWPERPGCSAHRTFSSSPSRTGDDLWRCRYVGVRVRTAVCGKRIEAAAERSAVASRARCGAQHIVLK